MIARKSALIMVTKVINAILGYSALFLIARYMDTPDYVLGVIGFAYSYVALFDIFANFGFDQAHIKRVSEGKDLGTCISVFITIKIILAGLMVALLFISVFVWKYVMGRGFESPEHETAIYVMLCYFVLWTLTQAILSTYNARRETAKAQIPFFIETLGRVAATFFVVMMGLNILALAYTYVISEFAMFITALLFFRGYPIGRQSLDYFKIYAKFAFPMVIVVASTRIMTNIDKVLLQLFWNASEVGNYFAVFRLTRFLDMATLAIGTLLFPTMSAFYAKNDVEGIKKLSITSERYLSMIIFPIVFFMIFLARPVIHILLSNKFYPAIPILQILPVFTLFDAMERPYQMKLLGMNLPNFTRNRVIIIALVNVCLNIFLIPRDINILGVELAGLGAPGAALATVVAFFAGLIYTRTVVWKISKIKINHRLLFHFFAALIMGVSLYYLYDFYPIARWYGLIAFSAIGMGIYISILYILKEFTREDFKLFMDTLNIKKMYQYVRNELINK